MNRDDYTSLALEIYDSTLYKGYKFRKDRNLNSWLAYSWGILFKRELTENQIGHLVHTCKQRRDINLKMLNKGFSGLNHEERINLKHKWIGSDGYVYMRKIIPFNEEQARKWEKRDQYMFDELAERKARELEQEKKDLKWEATKLYVSSHYYIKNGKIYER